MNTLATAGQVGCGAEWSRGRTRDDAYDELYRSRFLDCLELGTLSLVGTKCAAQD